MPFISQTTFTHHAATTRHPGPNVFLRLPTPPLPTAGRGPPTQPSPHVSQLLSIRLLQHNLHAPGALLCLSLQPVFSPPKPQVVPLAAAAHPSVTSCLTQSLQAVFYSASLHLPPLCAAEAAEGLLAPRPAPPATDPAALTPAVGGAAAAAAAVAPTPRVAAESFNTLLRPGPPDATPAAPPGLGGRWEAAVLPPSPRPVLPRSWPTGAEALAAAGTAPAHSSQHVGGSACLAPVDVRTGARSVGGSCPAT